MTLNNQPSLYFAEQAAVDQLLGFGYLVKRAVCDTYENQFVQVLWSSLCRVNAALAAQGVRAMLPIAEFELLDTPSDYPNGRTLTHSTVSLPAYPGLQEIDVMHIAQIAKASA